MRAVFPWLMLVACSAPTPEDVAPPPRQRRLAEAPPLSEIAAIEAPRSEPEKLDISLDRDTELRTPIHDGRLTLVPIVAKQEVPLAAYVTLQDGMRRGVVSVVDSYDVHQITVANRSDSPLVILGGEVVIEGFQDRAVAHDSIVAAHSTRNIGVFCVEFGRFDGSEPFLPSSAIAEPSLRTALARTPGDPWNYQSMVWDHVQAINEREGTAPRTGTLRYALQRQTAGRNAGRRAHLDAELARHQRLVGVAVAVDGKLVMIDRFPTPAMFQTLRPMLLASYLPGTAGKETAHQITPGEVRAFARATGSRPRGSLPAARN
jgi:hypothetical protein